MTHWVREHMGAILWAVDEFHPLDALTPVVTIGDVSRWDSCPHGVKIDVVLRMTAVKSYQLFSEQLGYFGPFFLS